jgi:hypothetical protein
VRRIVGFSLIVLSGWMIATLLASTGAGHHH